LAFSLQFGIVQNVRVQETVVAHVDVALLLWDGYTGTLDVDGGRANLVFFIDIDDLPAPLASTAEAHETGVAQSHVGFFARQDGLAGIGCAFDPLTASCRIGKEVVVWAVMPTLGGGHI
jgi:hypothetical protein